VRNFLKKNADKSLTEPERVFMELVVIGILAAAAAAAAQARARRPVPVPVKKK
jgi:hypothetical protein